MAHLLEQSKLDVLAALMVGFDRARKVEAAALTEREQVCARTHVVRISTALDVIRGLIVSEQSERGDELREQSTGGE